MPSVADALRQHADGYLRLYGNRVPAEHKRVLAAITRCRTGELGHLRYDCRRCRRSHWVGRSCGNRHCPNCQSDKTQVWLAKRTAQLLPVPYYLVTVTVPQALRKTVRANQRACYQGMFDAGSDTIRELASGPRFIGTDRLGFFGALHTWGRDPTVYHPHVHFVVPGGGVSQDGSRWQAGPANFLLPEKAASIVYRAKFRDPFFVAMREWQRIRTWLPATHVAAQLPAAALLRLRQPQQQTATGLGTDVGLVLLGLVLCLGEARNSRADRKAADPLCRAPIAVRRIGRGGEMQLVAITDGSGRLLYNHPLPYLDSS